MTAKKMKLNGDKPELIILSPSFNRQGINDEYAQVGNAAISSDLLVCNRGFVYRHNSGKSGQEGLF